MISRTLAKRGMVWQLVAGVSVWACMGLAVAAAGGESASPSGDESLGPVESVAIMGDSLATGAASNPQLLFDADRLWDLFKGEQKLDLGLPDELKPYVNDKLGAPVSLWQSPREFHGSLDWVYAHVLATFSKLFLDAEPYSWGYLTGRALGAPPTAIYMAAEDGARIGSLPRQADRLLNHLQGRLPSKVFVHFSGNDLCAGHLAATTSAQDFGKELQRGLQYLVRNAVPADTGTQVYVVGFLGVTQVLSNASILQKEVVAHGEKTTCQELRERAYQPREPQTAAKHVESLYFQQFIPPNPAALCPSLFAQAFLARGELGLFSGSDPQQRERKLKASVDDMISTLAGRVRSYRTKSQATVRTVNEWARTNFPDKRLTITYVPETELLRFEGVDISNDCFHLSLAGQLKVAEAVLQGVRSQAQLKAGG